MYATVEFYKEVKDSLEKFLKDIQRYKMNFQRDFEKLQDLKDKRLENGTQRCK